jgi:hypothetical protein
LSESKLGLDSRFKKRDVDLYVHSC